MLHWSMKIDGLLYAAMMRQVMFTTPLLTGGVLLSVVDQNEVSQLWTVEVEDTVIEVMPTDFAQYIVGSWVYLLKITASANTYDRATVYTHEPGEELRPVPIEFNGTEKVQGDFESKDYSLTSNFREAFELCYHTGIITDINKGAGTADVDITVVTPITTTTQSFSDVSIFYHCPNMPDTVDGSSAFFVGDPVIVLNENADSSPINSNDLSIIGFSNELRLCKSNMLIIKLYGTCTIINLEQMKIADNVRLNSGGFASFPVDITEISEWLANYNSDGVLPPVESLSPTNPTTTFPSECVTETTTYLQDDSPTVRCILVENEYDCSVAQTEGGSTENATKVGSRMEWSSSDEGDFLYDENTVTFYPFGSSSHVTSIGRFAAKSVNLNTTKYVYGSNDVTVTYSTRWEARYGFTPPPDYVTPCTFTDWNGTKESTTWEYDCNISSPWDLDNPTNFVLNLRDIENDYGVAPDSLFEIERLQELVSLSQHLAGGVVGNVENETPYMVSWYFWHVDTSSEYAECSTTTESSCEAPYPAPTITNIIDEFEVFCDTTSEDPKDLDPFNIPSSSLIKNAVVELCNNDVTWTKANNLIMEILY